HDRLALGEAYLAQDERGDAGNDEQDTNDRDGFHATVLPMPYFCARYAADSARSRHINRLHPAQCVLRQAQHEGRPEWQENGPHPELVEGRTAPIPAYRSHSSVNHCTSTRRLRLLSVPAGSSQPRPTTSMRLASIPGCFFSRAVRTASARSFESSMALRAMGFTSSSPPSRRNSSIRAF